MMETIQEQARALGKTLQQDERYLAFRKASADNDADSVLQNLIGQFNLKRLDKDNEAGKDSPDRDRLAALDRAIQSLYEEIMSNQTMVAYQAARAAFEQMLDGINRIIAMSAAGEDPETCDPNASAGCSGDCSACGGCH